MAAGYFEGEPLLLFVGEEGTEGGSVGGVVLDEDARGG